MDNEALSKVMKVLKLRQAALRVTVAKLDRGRAAVQFDPRLRDMFAWHQAHTGRWSSHGMQLHNLPRGIGVDFDSLLSAPLTLERVQAEADRLGVTADDVLASLVRATLIPPDGATFGIADYAQVECRCVAWMSGEKKLLDDLDGDVYVGMAKRLFGCDEVNKAQRFIGKTVVLGCGYGLSAKKLSAYCGSKRIDLTAAGITAEQCVKGFRESYPEIPRLWRRLDSLTKLVVSQQYTGEAARCKFRYEDKSLVVTLPSSRELWYREARIEKLVPAYAAWSKFPVGEKDTVVYESPRGTKSLYGGKILENVSQATCRDILADALVRAEEAGLEPCAHVHDEIVIQKGERLDELLAIMHTPPEWADGFPLKAEGGTATRYVK